MTVSTHSKPHSAIVPRLIAKLIDALLIAIIDSILMYAFWVIGMASGLLDATPVHWFQIFCTFPLFILDGLCVFAAPAALIYLNFADAFPMQTATLANIFFVTIISANWLYFSMFESSPTRGTPGKVFMELAVVGPNGRSIDFVSASIRHAAKLISALTLSLPLFGTNRNSCLHDLISNSSVAGENPDT